LKILYCSQGYSPHDFRFLSALAQSEHEIHWLKLEENLVLENRKLPLSINPVLWAHGQKPDRWLNYCGLKSEFKKVLIHLQPDLVHAGPIQMVSFLAALNDFHPLISMSWGTDLLMDADRDLIWQAVTLFTLRRSDWLIGDCRAVQEKAVSLGFDRERTTIFPWGIDQDIFKPSKNPILRQLYQWKDHFVILCTRNWEPRYGVELVVRAFCENAEKLKNAILVLVGGGSQEVILRKLVNDCGLSNRVFFAGRVEYADLPAYYQAADLYTSASHSDGSSVSLMEALGCGCPVLVSDIIANREWVQSGNQGWLFKDGDWQNLAAAMLDAYQHKDNLQPFRQNARQTALQRADWKKNSLTLLSTYNKVAGLNAGKDLTR